MNDARTLPELWSAFDRRRRTPIDWRAAWIAALVGVSGAALIWAGLTLYACGEPRLALIQIGAGVMLFVGAAQVRL